MADLLVRLADGASASSGVWLDAYDGSDAAERARLLNALAQAAGDSPLALEALLSIVDARRLAIPAIRRVLMDQDDVDDAHQDVLIQVARSVASFDQRSRFTTWLHSLARNVAIGHIRRQHQHATLPDEVASLSHRISSIVAARTEIHAAVDALPEPYATTVRLRDIDQLSYREIADRQEIEVNTVKSRLARGRALLAYHIGDLDG